MTNIIDPNGQRKILPINKMLVIAVLLAGLVNLSIYSTAATKAYTSSTTGVTTNVIPGDLPQLMQHEGLTATPQPWEDGMRLDPVPGTYEWWYIQGTFEDGSHFEFTFFPKPWFEISSSLDPFVAVVITSPDGKTSSDFIHASSTQFTASRGQTNVTIGNNNWLRGDLKTYQLHVQSPKGFGADLFFDRTAPSARGGGGTGKFYLDPSLTRYTGWFIALPSAKVHGTLTYNGETHKVHGEGYHDHNWGTVGFNQVLDRWFWTTGRFGNYTLDAFVQVASAYYNHQPMPAFYLAKGNQVLIQDMRHLTVQGTGNITAPGGHDYPKVLNFRWHNGSDTVKLSLTNPKIVRAASPIVVTNATIYGNPEYLRLSGDGTLNVNIGGKNETTTGPVVWEVNYGH